MASICIRLELHISYINNLALNVEKSLMFRMKEEFLS